MFATAGPKSRNDYSSPALTPHLVALQEKRHHQTLYSNGKNQQMNFAGSSCSSLTVEQQDYEHRSAATATGDSCLAELQGAITSVLAAKEITKQEYEQVQGEVNAWEKRLQIALENDCSGQVHQITCCKKACVDRAHHLKAAIDNYNISVSVLKNQLTFWESQLAY